jgi:diaminopimelate decarboxylase
MQELNNNSILSIFKMKNKKIKVQHPGNWGLSVRDTGSLMINDSDVVDIAEIYGTPLHIVNLPRLIETGKTFISQITKSYPGKTSVHFAFKSNSVPGVVQTIKQAGLKAEVMTDYELDLALQLGYTGKDIIVNGPGKTRMFLEKCLQSDVRLIVIDSLIELEELNQLCGEMHLIANVLFRINPNYTPGGMDAGTATANRKACAFGLDLKSGEVFRALYRLKYLEFINFYGYHMHIGTGIRDPRDYSKAIRILFPLLQKTMDLGLQIKCIDIGGGFASFTTRKFTTMELLLRQSFRYMPARINQNDKKEFSDFAREISETVIEFFHVTDCPELIFEPGRCIVSPNQFLILTVHRIKERIGVGRWLITDGGLGTCTLPTYYEFHEIFLCNEVGRKPSGPASIIGPCCFAADTVYSNKLMPHISAGEKIAIMDTGAYFTALESSFGFPRPAIAGVSPETHELIRHREDFEEMTGRDFFQQKEAIK